MASLSNVQPDGEVSVAVMPPPVREEWRPLPLPHFARTDDDQCKAKGWQWRAWSNRGGVAEIPVSFYCELVRGHSGDHTAFKRRGCLFRRGQYICRTWLNAVG